MCHRIICIGCRATTYSLTRWQCQRSWFSSKEVKEVNYYQLTRSTRKFSTYVLSCYSAYFTFHRLGIFPACWLLTFLAVWSDVPYPSAQPIISINPNKAQCYAKVKEHVYLSGCLKTQTKFAWPPTLHPVLMSATLEVPLQRLCLAVRPPSEPGHAGEGVKGLWLIPVRP